MSPKFVMLVGLPASGKSTHRSSVLYDDYVHISTDDTVEDIAAAAGKTYNEVWADAIADATLVSTYNFKQAIKDRMSIVWDQTNLTEKKRRKALSQLPKEYEKIAIYFEVDEDVRKARASARVGKIIPEVTIETMRQSYVRPSVAEGFDQVVCGVDYQPARGAA